MTPITLILLLITTGVSILAFQKEDLFAKLRFNAWLIHHRKQGYRFLSYGLIHADWIHLLINMFVLYSFGPFVEMAYRAVFGLKGIFYYILLYVGAIAFSTISSYAKHKDNQYYNAVGASGAISAIVFAAVIFNPLAPLGILFIPISIPAVLFAFLYLVYSAYMSKRGEDNIGHDAHFWGAIFGFAFTIALKPSLVAHMISEISQAF